MEITMRTDANDVKFTNIEKQFQFLFISTSPSTSNPKFACQIGTWLLHNHIEKWERELIICYRVASVTLESFSSHFINIPMGIFSVMLYYQKACSTTSSLMLNAFL